MVPHPHIFKELSFKLALLVVSKEVILAKLLKKDRYYCMIWIEDLLEVMAFKSLKKTMIWEQELLVLQFELFEEANDFEPKICAIKEFDFESLHSKYRFILKELLLDFSSLRNQGQRDILRPSF